MAHIHKTILINAPVEKIYAFARDPQRWHTWWMGMSEPTEIRGGGEAGTIVKNSVAIAGVPFAITTRVVEEQLTGGKGHWKAIFEGALSGTDDWTFHTVGPQQTEISVDINSTLPDNAVARIADRLLIERMEEKSIGLTLEDLKLLCEAEDAAFA